jgi:hypothetical protein
VRSNTLVTAAAVSYQLTQRMNKQFDANTATAAHDNRTALHTVITVALWHQICITKQKCSRERKASKPTRELPVQPEAATSTDLADIKSREILLPNLRCCYELKECTIYIAKQIMPKINIRIT